VSDQPSEGPHKETRVNNRMVKTRVHQGSRRNKEGKKKREEATHPQRGPLEKCSSWGERRMTKKARITTYGERDNSIPPVYRKKPPERKESDLDREKETLKVSPQKKRD